MNTTITTQNSKEKIGILLMILASICFAGGAAMKLIPWNALVITGM